MQICVLEDRICNNCGDCDTCDLDPQKRCTSCCACIGTDHGDMRTVIIKKEPDENEPKIKRNVKQWAPKDQ